MNVIKQIFNIWYKLPQGVRFILVGGYNTVFAYLLFSALYFLIGTSFNYSLVLLITYFIGIFNNFVVFKLFVFNTKGNWCRECFSTYITYSAMYPVNLLLLYIFIDIYGLSAYVGQAIAIAIMPIITYFILKKFAFKHKKLK